MAIPLNTLFWFIRLFFQARIGVESIKDKGVDWFAGIKDYNNRSYESGDMISVSFTMKIKTDIRAGFGGWEKY